MEKATFGAGCFWGVEETFRKLPGVIETAVGFMGGEVENPSYEQVCMHKTGHAEVVDITFNPEEISYKELLDIFWKSHNPTQLNRQGPDVGEQYRSVVFYHNDEQSKIAQQSKQELEESGAFKDPIVTQIVQAQKFYKAEEYHQKYLMKKGVDACHI